MQQEIILITFTTAYRKGGAKFKRVAQTMEKSFTDDDPVYLKEVNSKEALKAVLNEIIAQGNVIKAFHFIGHSGMYGPMFGTVSFPEQFSPHEIKLLEIPFLKDAKAYFHCCRSARWFAPFFAREKGVTTYGYHWYTTFSASKVYFKVDKSTNGDAPLYCFGCPGLKSHGIFTSAKKYLGKVLAEELKEFLAADNIIDKSYNKVAEKYAEVFSDIRVRKDEYQWIMEHLPKTEGLRVLDIGCGNGALLRQLSPKIEQGIGVDVSSSLLALAKSTNSSLQNLNFKLIEGPDLPFEENQFDVVISMLSFRYLDWDPIMTEISKVLKEDGKLLVIDMVTTKVKTREYPKLLWDKVRQYVARFQHADFYKKLQDMVNTKAWKQMLKYNPIRSEHEMKWYLESRFPGRKVEIINIGMHSRIIAFDSVNMKEVKNLKLSYP
ncbi:MAG: ubiquinone/menaquinone biosynthesis C-methylase UbiE [Marivirga sp.]|jgi:ubiquinone/menaquinone biosynthesis C-methylase UbiE